MVPFSTPTQLDMKLPCLPAGATQAAGDCCSTQQMQCSSMWARANRLAHSWMAMDTFSYQVAHSWMHRLLVQGLPGQA